MKHMKKILALMLAVVMTLAMSVTAFAEDLPYSKITINQINGNDHTFKAIALLLGKQKVADENGDALNDNEPIGALTFTGADVTATELLTAIKKIEANPVDTDGNAITATSSATAFAKWIQDNITTDDLAKKLAQALHQTVGTKAGTVLEAGDNKLPQGYYLIVDTTAAADEDSINASLLQLTRDVTVTQKTDVPEQEKKVKENVKYTEADTSAKFDGLTYDAGFNDVADYNIGDYVPYVLYSQVPDMEYFNNYHITFTDTMVGLTFADKVANVPNDKKLKVTIGSTQLTSDKYTLTPADNGFTLRIDLKKEAQGDPTDPNYQAAIEYTKDDIIKVEFYGQLNKDATIGLDGNTNTSKMAYSNNPNDTTGEEEKETPEDTVVVFTYELDVTKVDGLDNTVKLEGAQFALKATDGDHSNQYVQVDANGKVIGWTATKPAADATDDAALLVSDANGLFNVIGLDDGIYNLEEVKAPEGYNLISDPIVVKVVAKTEHVQTYKDVDEYQAAADVLTAIDVTGAVTANGKTNDATALTQAKGLAITIENNSGITLPETGGVGTTMFYVIGAILVIGAGIVLVTRRRMSA